MSSLNIFNIINISGAVIGLFLAIVILGIKKTDPRIRYIQATLLIFLSATIVFSLDIGADNSSLLHALFSIHGPIVFAIGPLVYLYIAASTSSKFTYNWGTAVHFIPFFIFVSLRAFLFQYAIEYNVEELPGWTNSLLKFSSFLRLLHLFIYLTIAFIRTQVYKRDFLNLNSSMNMLRINWLRFVIFALSTIILNDIACTILYEPLSRVTPYYKSFYNAWLSIVMIFLGYRGLLHSEITADYELNGNGRKKYEKSNLTHEKSDEYLEKLQSYMQNQKPFIRSDLTVKDLAAQLDIPARHLSQIINEKLEQNFFDFVNTFRVEEAKRQLLDTENSNYTILALAYDAGFKSKSTFNTVFRKYTNMSPSQFVKLHKK